MLFYLTQTFSTHILFMYRQTYNSNTAIVYAFESEMNSLTPATNFQVKFSDMVEAVESVCTTNNKHQLYCNSHAVTIITNSSTKIIYEDSLVENKNVSLPPYLIVSDSKIYMFSPNFTFDTLSI